MCHSKVVAPTVHYMGVDLGKQEAQGDALRLLGHRREHREAAQRPGRAGEAGRPTRRRRRPIGVGAPIRTTSDSVQGAAFATMTRL